MITTTIVTNLLTNMVVLGLHGMISTNTPTFRAYAFNEMFNSATNMAARWNLDFPNQITSNMVTGFHLTASPAGISGDISFNHRYFFSWLYGGNPHLNDQIYSCLRAQTPDVESNDVIFETWMHTTNLLTLQQAQEIAEGGITSVGVSLNEVSFKSPAEAYQFKYEGADGKIHLLPYYQFHWQTEQAACTVDVSGVIGKIVYFDYVDFQAAYLRLPKPTNYFEMLGLPPDPVFVHQMFSPKGQPARYELFNFER